MGYSLSVDLLPSVGDGARPDEDPQQVARPPDLPEDLPIQEAAPLPQLPHRSNFKCLLNTSVLHLEACLLEKIFGPNRVQLQTFQRQFKVLLQVGEPDPEGKVEISITGRYWCAKRAKKIIQSLTEKSRRKRYWRHSVAYAAWKL